MLPHNMLYQAQMGSTGIAVPTLNFVARQMVGGHRHAPAALLEGKNLPTCYTGSWVGPEVGLDGYEEKKILLPPGFKPRIVQPVMSLCTEHCRHT
jgi:hypothetical protein